MSDELKIGIGLGILAIVLIGISVYIHTRDEERLINDYMIEYKIDRATAERRVHIDQSKEQCSHRVFITPLVIIRH